MAGSPNPNPGSSAQPSKAGGSNWKKRKADWGVHGDDVQTTLQKLQQSIRAANLPHADSTSSVFSLSLNGNSISAAGVPPAPAQQQNRANKKQTWPRANFPNSSRELSAVQTIMQAVRSGLLTPYNYQVFLSETRKGVVGQAMKDAALPYGVLNKVVAANANQPAWQLWDPHSQAEQNKWTDLLRRAIVAQRKTCLYRVLLNPVTSYTSQETEAVFGLNVGDDALLGFEDVVPEPIRLLCEIIGHQPAGHFSDKNGYPGRWACTHSEKKAMVISPNSYCGVSITLCNDCQLFYQNLAKLLFDPAKRIPTADEMKQNAAIRDYYTNDRGLDNDAQVDASIERDNKLLDKLREFKKASDGGTLPVNRVIVADPVGIRIYDKLGHEVLCKRDGTVEKCTELNLSVRRK